jgi:hypothetical protein
MIVDTNLWYQVTDFGITLYIQFVRNGAAIDLTGATTTQLKVRWHDGTLSTFNCTDNTLATGILGYPWTSGDFVAGEAIGEATASAAGFSRSTKPFRFDVGAALAAL